MSGFRTKPMVNSKMAPRTPNIFKTSLFVYKPKYHTVARIALARVNLIGFLRDPSDRTKNIIHMSTGGDFLIAGGTESVFPAPYYLPN